MNSGTAVVLDNVAVDRTVRRLAHEIIEKNSNLKNIALIGIRTRGEFLAVRLHSLIKKYSKISVPIGSVSEYNTTSYSEDKIYLLERYISIDGSRMSPSDANAILAEVAAGYTGTLTEDIPNISDLYPGSFAP